MPTRHANEDTTHTPLGETNIPPLHPFFTNPPNQQPPAPITPTQIINAGYTEPPLPELQNTDIRVISHNVNTLPTNTPAELGATIDYYRQLNPTILCLQETNKNWTKYDHTKKPLRESIDR